MRLLPALGLACALPVMALAAPADYVLEPDRSTVGFETDFGPDLITGRMPVSEADLTLDFDRAANSTVAVTLDVSQAEASFPFAAQAMKGPKVLDAASHPTIRFESTSVAAEGSGARVSGKLTIRGVTRPASLRAEIYQQTGSAPGDLSHLTVRLTGAVLRSDFGATGWSDMVGDEVRLDILARIARKD
jgi:polyisoprenoid-binding protein YceI